MIFGRHSIPRPELGILAFKAKGKHVIAFEAKSFWPVGFGIADTSDTVNQAKSLPSTTKKCLVN